MANKCNKSILKHFDIYRRTNDIYSTGGEYLLVPLVSVDILDVNDHLATAFSNSLYAFRFKDQEINCVDFDSCDRCLVERHVRKFNSKVISFLNSILPKRMLFSAFPTDVVKKVTVNTVFYTFKPKTEKYFDKRFSDLVSPTYLTHKLFKRFVVKASVIESLYSKSRKNRKKGRNKKSGKK